MYARAVDEAASRLGDLRHEEWERLGLATLAFGLALAATQVRPAFALPFFAGGIWSGVLGTRAVWRRWDLVDRLSRERDAYVIPEVLAYASREATLERRRGFSVLIRGVVAEPAPALEPRIRAAEQDLLVLASELDDEELALDPGAAVACMRLVREFTVSPLLNPELPAVDLRAQVHRIRTGFTRVNVRPALRWKRNSLTPSP